MICIDLYDKLQGGPFYESRAAHEMLRGALRASAGLSLCYLGARANTYEIAKRYWTGILSMLHRRRYTRVLIEKQVAEKLAAHDVLRLVSELSHSGYRDISFAIVDLGYESQRAEFYELVAGNRGIMVKVTDNMDEAEGWLSDRRIPVRRVAPPPGSTYRYPRTA